jgi:PhnB protein
MKKIPEQYLPVMPYLIIKNAKAFEDFTKAVLGATVRYSAPRSEGVIAHAELQIGDAVIMYADSTDQYNERPAGMFIYVESVDNVYAAALKYGAKNLHEPVKQPYGYSAGFEDAWGNQWWVTEP